MRWSAQLHYVGGKGDHPPQQCLFPGLNGWSGREGINVLGGIRNTTGLLEEWVQAGGPEGDPIAEEALKFLIHFLGDLHMPLHLTGRDRGGNSDKVRWDGRITSEWFVPVETTDWTLNASALYAQISIQCGTALSLPKPFAPLHRNIQSPPLITKSRSTFEGLSMIL